eukprot:scaffold78896_cov24-Tisochrysis_lutea.AAC.1
MWDVGGDAQRKRVNMCALDVRWRMPAGKQVLLGSALRGCLQADECAGIGERGPSSESTCTRNAFVALAKQKPCSQRELLTCGFASKNGPLHVLKVNEGEGASVWEFVKKQGARVRCRHWSSQRQARPIQASSILCSISNAADTGQLKGRHRGKRG